MFKHIFVVMLVTSLSLFATSSKAQQGPSPEQVQTMVEMGNQVMQNMQDAGVDPLQLAGDAIQQMQNGTFDRAAFRQQLMDQGIISQQMISQLQGMAANRPQAAQRAPTMTTLADLQLRLNASDSEWKLIEPRVQRILSLHIDLGLVNWVANPPRPANQQITPSEISTAFFDLQAALDDWNTPPMAFIGALEAWRDAYARSKAALAATEKDLLALLTGRQEAVMVAFGVLR